MTNKDQSEPNQGFRVNVQLDSYRHLYDEDWATKLSLATEGAPKLLKLVFDLNLAWLATAQAANLPWVINAACNQVTGILAKQFNKIDRHESILNRCMELVYQSPDFDEVKRYDLAMTFRAILSDVKRTAVAPPEFKSPLAPDEYWQMLLKGNSNSSDFELSLWASSLQAFSHLYFAYEHFQDECLFIACRVSDEDRKDYNRHNSKKDLAKQHLGQQFADDFFGDKKLNIIREVRNAIAHRGGKQDHRLIDSVTSKKIHDYHVEPVSEKIQIQATDITNLYQYLKGKVWAMCDRLKNESEFK